MPNTREKFFDRIELLVCVLNSLDFVSFVLNFSVSAFWLPVAIEDGHTSESAVDRFIFSARWGECYTSHY